jgi:AcrR family transcriptional regulator
MPTFDVHLRRPHRADARRNFDALLAAARDAFAEHGSDASLEDIARRAGVGIATLYRNFPTRQDLFEAVYLGEVEQLRQAAREAAQLPPWEAWEAWLERFTGYAATKVAMQQALNKDSAMFRACRTAIVEASEPLFTRAQQAGEIRDDVSFDDTLRMLSGLVASVYADDEQRDRVLRVALDGLRRDR